MIGSAIGTGTGLYLVLTQDTSHGSHDDHDDHHEGTGVVAEEMAAKAVELKEAPIAEKVTEKEEQVDKDANTILKEKAEKAKEEAKKKAEEAKEKAKEMGEEAKDTVKGEKEEKEEPKEETKEDKLEKANKEDPNQGKKPSDTDKVSLSRIYFCEPANHAQPDARKEDKSFNEMSGKQSGLSNDETHHSTQPGKDDSKSKKGEGVADTAKLKGTVSPDRPSVSTRIVWFSGALLIRSRLRTRRSVARPSRTRTHRSFLVSLSHKSRHLSGIKLRQATVQCKTTVILKLFELSNLIPRQCVMPLHLTFFAGLMRCYAICE